MAKNRLKSSQTLETEQFKLFGIVVQSQSDDDSLTQSKTERQPRERVALKIEELDQKKNDRNLTVKKDLSFGGNKIKKEEKKP